MSLEIIRRSVLRNGGKPRVLSGEFSIQVNDDDVDSLPKVLMITVFCRNFNEILTETTFVMCR